MKVKTLVLTGNIEIIYSVWNISTGEFQNLIGKKIERKLNEPRFFIDSQSGTVLVTNCHFWTRHGEASLYHLDGRYLNSSGTAKNDQDSTGGIQNDPVWTISKFGQPEQYGANKVWLICFDFHIVTNYKLRREVVV